MVELALTEYTSAADGITSKKDHADIYHLINPYPTTWTSVRSIILDELNWRREQPIQIVLLRTWITKVR